MFQNYKRIGFGIAVGILIFIGQANAEYQKFQVINLTAATKNNPKDDLQFYDFKSKCTNDTERRFARTSYPFNVPVDIIIDKNKSCPKHAKHWYFTTRVKTVNNEYIGLFGWGRNCRGGNGFIWEDAPGHHFHAADGGNGVIILYVY